MKEKLRMLFDEKLWKFLLVGVLNTLVGNGLMFLLYNLAGFSYWPATGLSYALASVMSYFLNRYFTFKYQGMYSRRRTLCGAGLYHLPRYDR